MVFRRTLFGSPPSLLASLPRATDRNSTLARREALSREEARLTQRINQLRGEMDDLSNALHYQPPQSVPPRPAPPPGRTPPGPLHATESLSTLAFINAGRRAQNLPLLTERDIIPGPAQPAKAAKIDPKATANMILECGDRARGRKPK
jgi:hypothetical protein